MNTVSNKEIEESVATRDEKSAGHFEGSRATCTSIVSGIGDGGNGGADQKAHEGLVGVDRERLGEEISQIVRASPPEDGELALPNATP